MSEEFKFKFNFKDTGEENIHSDEHEHPLVIKKTGEIEDCDEACMEAKKEEEAKKNK